MYKALVKPENPHCPHLNNTQSWRWPLYNIKKKNKIKIQSLPVPTLPRYLFIPVWIEQIDPVQAIIILKTTARIDSAYMDYIERNGTFCSSTQLSKKILKRPIRLEHYYFQKMPEDTCTRHFTCFKLAITITKIKTTKTVVSFVYISFVIQRCHNISQH